MARAPAVNTISDVSEEFTQILDGEMLGDGYIRCYRDRDPRCGGTFRYTTSNQEYRDWLADLFETNGFEVNRGQNNDDRYTEGVRYRFQTLTYDWLGDQWDRWYSNGSKIVPEDFRLTPLSLRHWFIGDGSLSADDYIYIYSMGFEPDEVKRLRDMLLEVDIDATYQDSRNSVYIMRSGHPRLYEYMTDLPPALDDVYGYKWKDEVN